MSKRMEDVPHTFRWDGGGEEVFLVCSFNGWEKIRMKNNSNGIGGMCIDLLLPAGTHKYQFIVDGERKLDPSNTLPITTSGQNQVSITGGLQDNSDDVNSDTESIASQASSSGSGPKGQKGELYMTFPAAAKGQVEGYLKSSSFKDNIINVHFLTDYSAIVTVTPPSVAESVIAKMNGATISKKSRLKVKLYERKPRPPKTKPEAKVGGATCGSGSSISPSFSPTAQGQIFSESIPPDAVVQDPSVHNSPKKTQPGSAVKVTHLPPTVTGEKLYLHFRQVGEINGQPVIHATPKSIYAHVNFFHPHVAENAVSSLDQSVLDGTIIRVKLSTGSLAKNPVAKSDPDPDSCIKQLKFNPKQWNSLMLLNSRGTSQFKEISAPFTSNPNVVIFRNYDDQMIKFTGEQEAVQAAYDHFRKHLNKELSIERFQMEALVCLIPSLPDQIYQKYGVRVIDYTTGVTTIRFEGDSSGIEKARREINDLVNSLVRREIPVQEYELDRLEKAKKEIKHPVLVFPPGGIPRNSVILYSFQEASLQSVIPFVAQFLSVSQIPLECKGEEVVYLKHLNKAYVSKLFPVTITYKNNTALLSGTEGDVRVAIEKIQRDIFAGLLSRKFPFSCHNKYRDQIERRILQPFQSEDSVFEYFISSGQRKEKTRKKGNRASTESNEEFTIYVYCKKQDLFDKICHTLQRVNPCSKNYRVYQEDGKKVGMDMKVALENKFYVHIDTRTSSIIIFGLIPEEVEQCLEEIKEKVESKLMIFGFIPITRQMHDLLNCYYQEDLQKLRKDCADLVLLKPNKEHENFSIRLRGSINQVNDVKRRLNSGILSKNISIENFTLTCPAGLFGMWCQRWKQIREQEGRRSKILVSFSKSSEASPDNSLSITFEVVGEDEFGVQEIKESIVTEGAQTEEKIISLSATGINCLLKAKRDKKLDFLNGVIVKVGNINKQSHSVTVIAPKELSDNLDTAEEKIHTFVGDRANTSHVISSKDPVVRLILASPTYSIPYVTSANDIAKSKGASVQLLRKPSIGLRISGTESSIAAAKGLIYSTVIEAIEKTISERQVSVKPIYIPLLSTSDFSRFESKLETDLCVRCSRPRIGKTSKLICSSFIHLEKPGSYVKLDICKGNIVFEEVDAIVNAANEDLKHIGGLAKSISDAGGPSIQMDSDNFIRTNSLLKPGKAVCLGSGDLPCKNVIHAVGPRWHDGQHDEEQTLYSVIFECLKIAGDASLTSIALPAIGTGIFAVPEDICARASLKAVKEYFQKIPNGSIQNVRFILFQQSTLDCLKNLLESGLYGEYQGIRLSSNTLPGHLPNPAAHNWQWYNDQGSFSYYDSEVSSIITSAYQSNPRGNTTVTINSTKYTIDFGQMLQINTTTSYSRRINHTSAVSGVQWMYEDNHAFWPYSKEQSGAIEAMYSAKSPGQLHINSKVYTFDFNQMCQINVSTGFKRSIDRRSDSKDDEAPPVEVGCVEFEEGGEAKRDLTVTLRGPHKDLEAAEGKLMTKLKGSVKIQRISTLPKSTTSSLEKKLSQIASKNDVIPSFEEEGGKKRVMKLEGVSFKLQAAVSAIQEEILNFHDTSDTSTSSDEIVYPQEWVAQTNDIEVFLLSQGSQEWATVQAKFSLTMSGHLISKITRIQNKWLWEKYERHKKRMERKNNGLINEKELFHGTRTNDPVNIYKGEEGFDMRFSSKGMWGIANYFAVNASYSHNYAHQGVGGREMFLVKVLTGDSHSCPSNGSLRMPPVKNQGSTSQFAQMKYDTVTGNTNGSDVYMTYDNDKSYPAYLITYN